MPTQTSNNDLDDVVFKSKDTTRNVENLKDNPIAINKSQESRYKMHKSF